MQPPFTSSIEHSRHKAFRSFQEAGSSVPKGITQMLGSPRAFVCRVELEDVHMSLYPHHGASAAMD